MSYVTDATIVVDYVPDELAEALLAPLPILSVIAGVVLGILLAE